MGFKESLEIKANRTLVSLARPTQGGEGLVTLIYPTCASLPKNKCNNRKEAALWGSKVTLQFVRERAWK